MPSCRARSLTVILLFTRPLSRISGFTPNPLTADRIDERSVACHIPHSNARPLPIPGLRGPLKCRTAEWPGLGQVECFGEGLLAISPHDLTEREGESPLNVRSGFDGGRRCL